MKVAKSIREQLKGTTKAGELESLQLTRRTGTTRSQEKLIPKLVGKQKLLPPQFRGEMPNKVFKIGQRKCLKPQEQETTQDLVISTEQQNRLRRERVVQLRIRTSNS